MSNFFFALVIISMLAVLATLLTGVIGMARGGTFNARYGNKLMRLRVLLQGVTLLLFALAVMTRH
jgi:hypothetical protein